MWRYLAEEVAVDVFQTLLGTLLLARQRRHPHLFRGEK